MYGTINCVSLQFATTHSDKSHEEGLLQLSAQGGAPFKVVGSVQGSVPVLCELNGVVFKQLVPLTGTLLLYRSKAPNANLLPTVIGKETRPLCLIEATVWHFLLQCPGRACQCLYFSHFASRAGAGMCFGPDVGG